MPYILAAPCAGAIPSMSRLSTCPTLRLGSTVTTRMAPHMVESSEAQGQRCEAYRSRGARTPRFLN